MKNVILMTAAFSVLVILGCDKKQEPPKESPKPTTSNVPVAVKPANSHDHKPGEKHAEEHKEEDGHDHGEGAHGEAHELGTVDIFGFQVRAVSHGEFVAGNETDIDVFVSGGTGSPSAVRLWIGSEDGKGAMKMKATANKNEAHNHVVVPKPLPADARLCVELELTGGEKKVGVFPLPK